MLRRGPITPMDALREAKCMRLAARIDDLKREGHSISMEMINDRGKRYARYKLIKENNG